MLSRKALVLWTLSSALLISACEPEKRVEALPIPPERTDCEAATGKRPTLPPEYSIDWAKIANVGEAKAAHDNFVNVIRGREKIVATYILEIEGRLFQCASDAEWLRDWQKEIAR